MREQQDRPIVLPLASGVVRPVQLLGAERFPAGLGCLAGFLLFMTAIYGQWNAIYGLILVFIWHGIWMLLFTRDPQYGDILIRSWITYPYPVRLYATPGLGAKSVKIEPSVPVRG